MSTLSKLAQFNNENKVNDLIAKNNSSSTLAKLSSVKNNSAYAQYISSAETEEAKSKNNGGFFGGLGYLGHKMGLGFLSAVEGIWDYTAGGLAKLFGADDWAERQFANDWVNYNHADEWYNPSDGWKVAGDVAGGIGSSLPSVAALAAVGWATGGAAVPAMITTFLTSGLSAAGNATKEAYRETGELGGKEFGYGALVGATEGAVETFSDMALAGVGGKITKAFNKDVVSTVATKTLGKEIAKSFLSEGFEEVIGTVTEPYWKRLTYDKDAENASFQEIGYAALVGGLSGAIMTGAGGGWTNARSVAKGTKIVKTGTTSTVLQQAQSIQTYENQNHTENEVFEAVNSTYNELQQSLQKTNGNVETVKQKMLLGRLQSLNTQAILQPTITTSAENIFNNAEEIANRMNQYGYKDTSGNPITITAEQIRQGIDTTNAKTFKKSMVKALKNNSVLRTLSVMDATGQIMLDTVKYKEAALTGQTLSSQVDLNRFIETATDSELKAVGEKLGIDNWRGLTSAEFQEKITDFVRNGGVETYKSERLIVKDADSISADTAQKLPSQIDTQENGIKRYYLGDSQIAIIKDGDNYRIYDYSSKRLSKVLTKSEVNEVIKQLNTQEKNVADGVKQQLEQESELARQAAEIDEYARENISEYKTLNAASQSMIRQIIRNGRAAGVSEDFVLTTARVSARSGLNIVFSKEASFVTANGTYADGAIDLKNNQIIINPEAKNRTGEMILIHELTHAIYNLDGGVLQVAEGLETMSDAEKKSITDRYTKIGKGSAVEVSDEINAHFAEQTLSNKNILERLVAKKPTVKEKILNFFKKSSVDYSEDTKLTGAAKKLFKQYQKLFNDFSARNQGNNATEINNAVHKKNDKNLALSDAFEKLGEYTEEEIKSIETNKQFKVAKSYNDVKNFIESAQERFGVEQKNLFLGKISVETSAKILTETGINVEGKSFVLNSDNIRHIFLRHGENGVALKQGDIAVTSSNFENIIETLIDPDSVTRTDRDNVRGIMFQKEINGKTTAITVVSEKKKALTLKSAWIVKTKKQATSPSLNAETLSSTSETLQRIKPVSTSSISKNIENVNTEQSKNSKNIKYALPETDSNGTKLSQKQREYFADSKVVDKNGNLKVVYHGSKADITEFDSKFTSKWNAYGDGFYFTSDKSRGERYAKGKLLETYLDIKTPLYADNTEQLNLLYDKLNLKQKDIVKFTKKEGIDGSGLFELNYYASEHNINIAKAIQELGFDGIISKQADNFEYVVYKSNQVKNTTNLNPTKSQDIRYAISEVDSNGKVLSEQQKKYFKDSKVVDENGNLLVVYHHSPNEFTVFDKKKIGSSTDYGAFGRGFYFAETEWSNYGKYKYEVYLNIKNPYVLNGRDEVYNFNKKVREFVGKNNEDININGFDMEKVTQELKNRGYDGVIFKAQNRFERSEYVAFEPNQIKEITNINPTISQDIRYALDKNDDIKNLVAIHNTTESKLLQTMELGGLPMPSIAIIKNDMAHENFGNISLIFKSDTIDPTKNYDNKVYSADAYSPRFPQTAYKLNGNELKILADKIDTSVSMLEANEFAEGNTREKIVDTLKYNDKFIEHYLKEFNVKKEIAYKSPEYSQSLYMNEDLQNFLKKDYSFSELVENDSVRKELLDAVNKAKEKKNLEFRKNMLQRSYEKFINQLDVVKENGYELAYAELEQQYNNDKQIAQGKAKDVIDTYQTRQNIIEKLKKDKNFNKYAEESVDKVLKKRYLRNNKDYYTYSGIPRSFDSLYDEYTAENAVRIMKEQGGKNSEGGGFLGYGVGEIRAALSKIYNNIAEMHKDEHKLQNISDDSSLSYVQCNTELHDIASSLATKVKTGNIFEDHEIALSAIFDIISKTKTNDQVTRLMKRDYSFEVNNNEVARIRKLAENIAQLPVKYFEAKPERVVAFDEILEVIAPVDTNKQIVDFFNDKGVKVEFYDENTSNRSELIKNLPDNIRFALAEDENNKRVGGLTKAQRAKFVANNTKLKVYSRTDAEVIINDILTNRLNLDERYVANLSGKSKNEIIDYLFKQLNGANEGYRGTVALKIADFIIENATMEDMCSSMYDFVDDTDVQLVAYMNKCRHSFDLSGIQGEINYKFDRKNTIFLQWGTKNGGMGADQIAQEIEGMGLHTFTAINEADQFFEMLEAYDSAKKQLNKKVDKKKLTDYGDQAKIDSLRQEIAKDILKSYDSKGTQSKYGKLVDKYNQKIANLRQQVKDVQERNNVLNNLLDKAQKMKELKLGTFLNATDFKSDTFKQSIESLAKIKFRGNFNNAGTHRILSDLRQWYSRENPLLENIYNEDVEYMLDTLSKANKNYTTQELKMLRDTMSYFINLVENYNRIYKQGKWVEAIPEAQRYIDVIHSNEQLKVGIFSKLAGSGYMQTFGDPLTVARRMDRYDSNGFYTEMMTELRNAAVDSEIAEMEVKSDYNEFLSTNKKYLAEIKKNKVKFNGVEIPKTHLISLYMTMKRSHSNAGLVLNGFSFIDTDGKKVRVNGFAPSVTSDAEILTAIADAKIEIENLLSDTDMQYVAILEKAYNVDAKKLKADRDMQRLGYTNATEDYYYPIRRGNIAKNIDTSDIASELDRVSNSSFNKDTVKGAKQELFIESADTVFNRHIKAVTKYAYLSPAIETFNRLYSLDISGNKNKPVSVSTESANTWSKASKYFSKLISDIQGIPSSSSEGMKVLSFIRSSYAKFQLGANPKVWVTQLSSIFASSSMLDTDCIIKGMTVSAKDVDTYCSLAKLRNSDNTVAMAQGLLDKVGKFSNALMAPIGKMDRFVVKRLFGACQVQVEKNGGAKVGTTANKVEAGKLLRNVILETQQNSMATERSAAMRSGNEIMRTITMFSADSMKVAGRVIDAVGELSTLKAKLKTTTESSARSKILSQIKVAKTKVRKAVTALITSAAFMAGVAKFFRWLYRKDEDENTAEVMTVDFVGNLFGGLPVIKEIYGRFAEGYDVDNYAYSAVNDLLDSVQDLYEIIESLTSGNATEQDINKAIKNLSFSAGQILGIPTRNMYNILFGLTKRVSPTTAYQFESKIYKKNFVSDLNEAIENDDTEMINLIMSMILEERVGDDYSEVLTSAMKKLYTQGYSVLPKSIGSSITYNGETISLTSSQQKKIKSVYSKANIYAEKMVLGNNYKNLTEEQQAKALKQLYDAYYAKALQDTLGIESDNKLLKMSKYISIDKMAAINAGLSGITSDKTSTGKVVTGSKRSKVIKYLLKQNLTDEERLLILAYQGYTVNNLEYKGWTTEKVKNRLLRYILSIKTATQAEKIELCEMCGFEVKNGVIVKQSLYSKK